MNHTTTSAGFKGELEGLGFKGRTLLDMDILINSEGDLEELESFIVNHEHEYATTIGLANGYREFKAEQSNISEFGFIENYENCFLIEEKQKCIENLLKGYIDIRWAKSFDDLLNDGDTTLTDFYRAYKENPRLHVKKMILEAVMLTENAVLQ